MNLPPEIYRAINPKKNNLTKDDAIVKLFAAIFSVILLLLLTLLFAKLNFCFESVYNPDDKNRLSIRFYVFSRRLGFKIKFKDKPTKKHNSEKTQKNNSEKKHEEKEKKNFIQKSKDIKNGIEIFKTTLTAASPRIKKAVVVKNININAEFGLGDAALTGISTGALWGILYSAFSVACNLFTVKDHNFKINPIFNKKIIKIKSDGIIYTRLVNLIIAAAAVYKSYSASKKA